MKNKKKLITSIIASLLILALVGTGIYFYFNRYAWDKNDTEDLYMQNIASVGYENTVETAYPQTELYKIIDEHFRSELPEGKTEKKAIIIGYDGCRADILAELKQENSVISTLLNEGASINLSYCGGVNYPEKNTQATSTAPGWCSILTGQWADVHGITGNDITKSMDTKTLMTSLTEEKVIDSASFITKWAGHFSRKDATYLLEKEYCEENNLPVAFNKCDGNKESLDAALAEIGKEDCSDFIFVIYEQTDSTGHNKGFSFNNPLYKEAFTEIDSYGYETLEAIRERESYESEDWLIIVTSDHGGKGKGHGKESNQERMTFVVMNRDF